MARATRRHRGRWAGIAAVVLAGAGLTLCAQQPAATPGTTAAPAQAQPTAQLTFRAEANFIEVDAIVTDAQGRFGRDLVASDFEVLENKKPQTVDVFLRWSTSRSSVRTSCSIAPNRWPPMSSPTSARSTAASGCSSSTAITFRRLIRGQGQARRAPVRREVAWSRTTTAVIRLADRPSRGQPGSPRQQGRAAGLDRQNSIGEQTTSACAQKIMDSAISAVISPMSGYSEANVRAANAKDTISTLSQVSRSHGRASAAAGRPWCRWRARAATSISTTPMARGPRRERPSAELDDRGDLRRRHPRRPARDVSGRQPQQRRIFSIDPRGVGARRQPHADHRTPGGHASGSVPSPAPCVNRSARPGRAP